MPEMDPNAWVGNNGMGDESIRQFKEDVDGVAAVIGTILALMVFLALMSMIVLYWVPVAMEGNEKSHMNKVIQEFSDLKNGIDAVITSDIRNDTRGVTIDLGADGYPMFERETPGQLSLKPSDEHFNLSFADSGENVYENSSGSIDFTAYNRFYVRQTLIYENGAVILHQSKGDVLRSEPNLAVEMEGGNVILGVTLISLHHDTSDSIAGTSSEDVRYTLWYTDRWTYTNITSNYVTISIVSEYADAWESFYNKSFTNEGLVEGTDFHITATSNGIIINIDNVARLSVTHAYMETFIGRGVS
ncbi:MAG: hypothetical protein JSW28_07580 [Thermoplasmata archaeon]|nr:MAG: hypothetical protein JSW28_07580 [Thermoplasmata archaeon]